MKFSRAASLAIHAVCHLAREGVTTSSHQVSEAHNLPAYYLLKCLKPLASCEPPILISLRGPGGGYRLARPAKKINLLEIIEAADGRIRSPAANSPHHCGLGKAVAAADDAFRKELSRWTIADLLDAEEGD